MTDNIGYGKEKRRAGNLKVLEGEATFRYVVRLLPKGDVLTAGITIEMLSARCWTV